MTVVVCLHPAKPLPFPGMLSSCPSLLHPLSTTSYRPLLPPSWHAPPHPSPSPGVNIPALEAAASASGKASESKTIARSPTVLLVKNLPYTAVEQELDELFGKWGQVRGARGREGRERSPLRCTPCNCSLQVVLLGLPDTCTPQVLDLLTPLHHRPPLTLLPLLLLPVDSAAGAAWHAHPSPGRVCGGAGRKNSFQGE